MRVRLRQVAAAVCRGGFGFKCKWLFAEFMVGRWVDLYMVAPPGWAVIFRSEKSEQQNVYVLVGVRAGSST